MAGSRTKANVEEQPGCHLTQCRSSEYEEDVVASWQRRTSNRTKHFISFTRFEDNWVISFPEEENGECHYDEEEEKGQNVYSDYWVGSFVEVGDVVLIVMYQLTLSLFVVWPVPRPTSLIFSFF